MQTLGSSSRQFIDLIKVRFTLCSVNLKKMVERFLIALALIKCFNYFIVVFIEGQFVKYTHNDEIVSFTVRNTILLREDSAQDCPLVRTELLCSHLTVQVDFG